MGVVIGIDVGGSTTKIVGFRKNGSERELIKPMFVRANDPITSLYGAFGKFTDENSLDLGVIERIITTGVGSSKIKNNIYGLECVSASEFNSIGRGGLYLSGLEEAIVVSLGTGTAIVHATKEKMNYLGGTGVGGGTLVGLSKLMLGLEDIKHIDELAADGNLDNIDWRIKDITKKNIVPGMPEKMTASNFGNVSEIAEKGDIALGIMNLVYETIGMVAIFAARAHGLRDIVLTGNLTILSKAKETFATLNSMFDMNFIIPELSQFGTVIGAALKEG
jgi:type II pantothenate kinase